MDYPAAWASADLKRRDAAPLDALLHQPFPAPPGEHEDGPMTPIGQKIEPQASTGLTPSVAMFSLHHL